MTHFEFVSVAVSLVYAVVLSRLLGSLPAVLAPDRRYWVHAAWALVLLGLAASNWYALWRIRDSDFTPPLFVLVLAQPAVMYVRATVLVSQEPGRVSDWKAHYYKTRVPFFAIGALGATTSALVIPMVVGESVDRLGTGVALALILLALVSANERVQAGVAVLAVVGMLNTLFSAIPTS